MYDGHGATGQNGSKRIAAFPWFGGKYRLAPRLAQLLPQHKIYVEVFGGAASVLLAKRPSEIEAYNDRNGMLVNFFETVRKSPVQFLKRCEGLHYSRQLHYEWADQLEEEFQGVELDNVERAVRTVYAITSGFAGDPTKGWAYDRSGSKGGAGRWTNITERIAFLNARLRSVNIDNLDFRTCIKNWDSPDTVFFLDPPYLFTTTRSYYSFSWQDHKDLALLLRSLKGKFLLIYDDSRALHDMYQGFNITNISSFLSSQKVSKNGSRVPFHQILISNYELDMNIASSSGNP